MSDHDEPTRGRHAGDTGSTNVDTEHLSGAYVLDALSDDERQAFEAILDDVRRELAWELSATALQVSQISTMLGYAEQSSYARACRRWHALSPRQLIRNRHAMPDERGAGSDMGVTAPAPPVAA